MKSRQRIQFTSAVLLLAILFLHAACRNPDPPSSTPVAGNPTDTSPPILTFTPTTSNVPLSGESSRSALESLATVSYLGRGRATYQISAGIFLVKRTGPFRFDQEPGPTYTARANEDVWHVIGDVPIRLYDQVHSFGQVRAGCEVRYLQIDDNEDDRRNRFYINGQMVHEMPQGMVVTGSFAIRTSGELTLNAQDSIGAQIELFCPPVAPSPTSTPTHTPTSTPTNTSTPPGGGTVTPTVLGPDAVTQTATATTTVTSTPTPDSPIIPSPTATATGPAVTATITPTPTPTIPVGPAYTRFNFAMAGHEGRDGYCYMHRDTGELLLIWQMQDGWVDSAAHPDADADGWIEVYIQHPSIYVEVFCDTGNGRIRMDIHNGVRHPNSGKIVGWLTRGVHHAIEIGWPE